MHLKKICLLSARQYLRCSQALHNKLPKEAAAVLTLGWRLRRRFHADFTAAAECVRYDSVASWAHQTYTRTEYNTSMLDSPDWFR
jgi:hypothetical protein